MAAALLLGAGPAAAKVYRSRSEALALAFPDTERVERHTFVLTEAQAEAVQQAARAPLDSKIVTLHRGLRDGAVQGYALIDVHTVRTLPEALMIVLTPAGEVRSLRMLAFHEPEEYRPSDRWLEQLEGGGSERELRLGRDIHAIAGSTLSSRAVTRSVRRARALHRILVPEWPAPTANDAE